MKKEFYIGQWVKEKHPKSKDYEIINYEGEGFYKIKPISDNDKKE